MKNIFIYYIAIIVPLLAIIVWMNYASRPHLPVIALFMYYPYRTLTDGYRLYKKGLIKKKDLRKLFVPYPFNTMLADHFKDLYLRR
jgi:hypothetical protein